MSAAMRERSPERQARAIIGVAMLRTRTMIPITTSNSVSVKPRRLSGRGIDDIVFGPIEAVGAGADQDEPVLLARRGGHGRVAQEPDQVVRVNVHVALWRRLHRSRSRRVGRAEAVLDRVVNGRPAFVLVLGRQLLAH